MYAGWHGETLSTCIQFLCVEMGLEAHLLPIFVDILLKLLSVCNSNKENVSFWNKSCLQVMMG